jgi:predicted MPP superfamily phosphohydrolase
MMPLYNLLMAAVDVAVVVFLRKRRSGAAFCAAMLAAGGAAVVLAGALGEDGFGVMRLAAYGLFLHAVVLLIASAVLLRRVRKLLAAGSGMAAAVLLLVAGDAFLIEPTWLEVTHRQIASPKIGRPVRIVVLADLQTDRFGTYERRVLDRVMQERPDLVLLAGDYVQRGGQEGEEVARQINAYLRKIRLDAPLGVFAVRGNVDGDLGPLFAGLPVTVVESTESFEPGPLRLTCLAYEDSRNTSLEITRGGSSRFHLVLGHVPNFALGRIDADLLVAGHTHGGQVRLPLAGPLLTLSRVPRSWAAGLTDLPGGGKLLVSRGVGMERGHAPRLRFCCRPELAVIDLAPE